MKAIEVLYERLQALVDIHNGDHMIGLQMFIKRGYTNYSLAIGSKPVPAYILPVNTFKCYPREGENTLIKVIETDEIIAMIIIIDMIIEYYEGTNFLNTDVWVETYSKLQNKYAQLRDENAASASSSTKVAE